MNSKVEILTGVRPTAGLTVANYLGAIKPIIEFQEKGLRPFLFVADIHALTDTEPAKAKKYVFDLVADYIALGIDPDKTVIYKQSDIAGQISFLTAILARHISVAELLRVPTLKDKLKSGARPETANALLFLYPVMMAADILIQQAKKVPVGEDQSAHLEAARELARRFNKKYGNVFILPSALEVKSLRILSLRGKGKMSKTSPAGALFLTEDLKSASDKIKKSETAFEGKMTEKLKSHIILARGLAKNEKDKKEIDLIIEKHKKGEAVMGEFKKVFTRIVLEFLKDFQGKRKKIIENPEYISLVLEKGKKIAEANANKTMALVEKALFD